MTKARKEPRKELFEEVSFAGPLPEEELFYAHFTKGCLKTPYAFNSCIFYYKDDGEYHGQ
jgi:hypothetical protein